MRELTDVERQIVKELIKNPRESDNGIAKRTRIPVMTVNRKRKLLESEGLIQYYTSLQKSSNGLQLFEVSQLYILKFRAGLTKKEYIKKIESQSESREFNAKFVNTSYLGEKDGHLALVMILEAPNKAALTEEFNGQIIPFIRSCFGEHAIEDIQAVHINDTIRVHHNYLPESNMKDGKMKKDWPDEYIFVDDISFSPKKKE
ncbi:MAG: winged helix-turn-helix transcriptional regulator [Candidatus Woesearchaeota archaeon]